MFDDDNAARRALGALTDEPAPPVTTSLDQVRRRGRRRVFVQRASAVAGVVAVVAAIGVTTALLRAGGADQVRVADPATSRPAPTSTADAPLPGWHVVRVPANCHDNPIPNLPAEPDIPLLPQEVVQPAFSSSVDTVSGHAAMIVNAQWLAHSVKQGGSPRGYVTVELPVAGTDGNGQVQLETSRFSGTPGQAADADIGTFSNCRPPARHVLADGTVLQLSPVDNHDPEIPKQHLQIFTPDGRQYILTSAGYGEADLVPAGGSSYGVAGGRGKLPVTEAQLADIGLGMVAKLSGS